MNDTRRGPMGATEAGPLSALQQGFWMEYQRDPGSPRFNRGTALRLRGSVDTAALEDAWHRVVARHPMLRATIVSDEGGTRQVVRPASRDTFARVDARGLSGAALVARAQEEIDRPFDLEHGPVIRAVVLDTDDGSVFITSKPHVHADAGAVDLIHHELGVLLAGGELGPEGASYLDFARWQADMLNGDEGAKLRAYWTEQLGSAPKILALPADHPRVPGVRPFQRSLSFVLLDEADAARFGERCKALETTRFRFLLALWSAFLYRYTQQEDFLVGTPVDCRGKEHASTIGNFANMIAVRAQLDRATPFRDLLARTTETVASGIAHRHYPLVRVIAELLTLEERGVTPLYQTGFAMGRLPRCASLSPMFIPTLAVPWKGSFGPVEVDGTLPIYQHGGQLELEMLAVECAGKLGAELKYDEALFDHETIVAMSEHLRAMLLHALDAPDAKVGELRMISEAERKTVVEDWNATERPFSGDACMHHLIEAQAARTPRTTAVAMAGTSITYAELEGKANALARRLREAGVGSETRVTLLLPRSIDVLVAVLATWKAGGAYVPVDPAYPADRIAFMLEDAAPVVTLVSRDTRALAPPGASVLEMSVAELSVEPPVDRAPTDARSLAYVIYTSGSTGLPKGVLVEHRGVCNYAEDLVRRWQIGAGDRVLAFASFSFDSSVADIVSTLSCGATLHVRPSDVLGGRELSELLLRERITHADLPPAVWATLPAEESYPDLKTVISSGDACSATVTARFAPGRLMLNEYGPTENTVCSTSRTCVAGEVPNIGTPIANVRVFVLDEGLAPVPIGVPGELYLTGVGLARGYWRREELTRERFVDCPFLEGGRMYRSGDLGRWNRRGELEFLGRLDDQVKIRGFRIELGEVETALRGLPSVRDAVVIVRAIDGRKQLVAYVVTDDPSAFVHADARRRLRAALPRHMMPAFLVPLAKLPLTTHGKVDRRALPEPTPDPTTPDRERDAAAESGATEAIAEAWKRVLGVSTVSAADDFFDHGGDSLLVLELLHDVAVAAGCEVGVDEFFRDPTFGGLLRRVQAGDGAALGNLFEWTDDPQRDPVFFVHPEGGEVAVYDALARNLPTTWAAVGLRATVRSPNDLPSLVASHADAVAARARGAPIHLVGWSSGGVFALLVACELERRGTTVDKVVLVDTHLRAQQASAFARVAPDLGALAGAFGRLDLVAREQIGAQLEATAPGGRRAAALEIAASLGLIRPGVDLKDDPVTLARAALHHKLLSGLALPKLGARVVHIHASESAVEPDGAWDELGQAPVAMDVVGSHYGILREPQVGALAARVAAALALPSSR